MDSLLHDNRRGCGGVGLRVGLRGVLRGSVHDLRRLDSVDWLGHVDGLRLLHDVGRGGDDGGAARQHEVHAIRQRRQHAGVDEPANAEDAAGEQPEDALTDDGGSGGGADGEDGHGAVARAVARAMVIISVSAGG